MVVTAMHTKMRAAKVMLAMSTAVTPDKVILIMHTHMRAVKVMLAMSTIATPDKVILIPAVTDMHTEMEFYMH